MPLTSSFLHNSISIHPLVFSFLYIIFCYFQVKLLLDKSSFTASVTSNLFPVSNCNYDHSQRTLCEHSMHFSGGVLNILRTVYRLLRVIFFLQPQSSPFLLVLVTFPFSCWIFFSLKKYWQKLSIFLICLSSFFSFWMFPFAGPDLPN